MNLVRLFATARGRMRALAVFFTLLTFSYECEGDRECFLRIDNGFLTSCGFETNRFRTMLSMTKRRKYKFVSVEMSTLRYDDLKLTLQVI